jgi:pimeloyl-ACP methyl ester carboxylesterase
VRGPDDGEVVLLIMGGDGSLLWWPPELVDALVAAGRRVVLYDNRDCGLSSYVSEPYDIDDMVSDALGLLDALEVDRAHVGAVSMGGMIAQVLALTALERVRSLTLISTTPGPDERLAQADGDALAGIDWDGDPIDVTVAFCRAMTGSRFPFDEARCRELATADAARGVNPETGHHHVLQESPSRVDRLTEIAAPTLVVHGTEDPIFPYAHAQALASGIAGAELLTWDGVGHELPPALMRDLATRIVALV